MPKWRRVVGLGSSAVHERVKRLEQRGYVKGYGARLDAQKLGIELVAFVSVYTQHDVQYDPFHSAIAALPEVSEVYSVAGEEIVSAQSRRRARPRTSTIS